MRNYEGQLTLDNETVENDEREDFYADEQIVTDTETKEDYKQLVARYAEYLRGNIELSEEEAKKMHVFDDGIYGNGAYEDCRQRLDYIISLKVGNFVSDTLRKNNYGEDEQTISLSEQHEQAERLLDISAEEFDALFEDALATSKDESEIHKEWQNGRRVLFAFMRGEFRLTTRQATELLGRHEHLIQSDRELLPYHAAITAMHSIEEPWEERRQIKAERNLMLHKMTFETDDKTVRETVEPFMEAVREDEGRLLEIIASIDFDKATTKQIQKLVDFFAEKFGISDDIPQVRIAAKLSDGSSGTHYQSSNRIEIAMDDDDSIASIVGTIAHETWHAYQRSVNSELYRYNLLNYVSPDDDYNLYRKQIMEKEAWEVGKQIGDIIRRAYLKAHPEKIPRMAKLHKLGTIAAPYSGLDKDYYRLAYEMQMKPKPHRGYRPKTSFFGGFKGFRGKRGNYE